jgi:hypothetical protein
VICGPIRIFKNFIIKHFTGFDPRQFLLDTTIDGIAVVNPDLEIFGQMCKGISGAASALNAGESTIKAIKCVGTGMGNAANAAGCTELGLITGVVCGLADYTTTANSNALIHAADSISATLLGTPPGMLIVGDMAVTAIRGEINHRDFRWIRGAFLLIY